MNTKIKHAVLFLLSTFILVIFTSCGPAVLPQVGTPTPVGTLELLATPTALETATPTAVCAWPCSSDSSSLTAAMGTAFAITPTNTPPPWATIVPAVGDLGWGSVYGTIVDGATGLPIEGATVTCEHSSYRPLYRCEGTTTTNSDGIYSFTPVFFHDTDRITLIVEAAGYLPLRFEETFLTRPDVQLHLGLFPVGFETPTPAIMCSPPPCSNGVLSCGVAGGCPGGCGTICLPFTTTP